MSMAERVGQSCRSAALMSSCGGKARGESVEVIITNLQSGSNSASIPDKSLSRIVPKTSTGVMLGKYSCSVAASLLADSWLCAQSSITGG